MEENDQTIWLHWNYTTFIQQVACKLPSDRAEQSLMFYEYNGQSNYDLYDLKLFKKMGRKLK